MATGRDVMIRLRGEIGDFQAKMVAAGKSVGGVADKITSAEKESARFRQGLTGVADTAGKMGLAAAGGLAYVTKAASDWETAWAGVTKTVDGSPEQMAALEEELRNLAKTLPATHQEIAGVAEAAGQLGIAREDVADFTETMVALGETTNLTADEAATSIARFSNIMGTSADEVERIGSALVDLGNNSATTEAEILAMGQRLSAAGAIAGLAESDVLAFAATLTSVGVEAEAGGTALSKVFTSVRDASIDGGDALDTFARVAGVSAGEFKAAFEEDAAGAVDMFIQGLGQMNAAGESTSSVFKELKLTDQRLMRALLSTAEAGDLLSDSLQLGGEAWEDNTALAIEAAKRYETTASQMQVSWNNVKDAAIEFGEVALPVLAGAADKIAALAQAAGSLPGPVKTATTSMLGLTAVFGGGLWFTAKTINGVAAMRENLQNLGPAGTKAAGALGKVSKAAGLAAIAVAGISLADSVAKMGDETLPGLEEITGQIIDMANGVEGARLAGEFDNLGESIDRLTDKNTAQRLNDSLSGALGGILEGGSLREAKADVEAVDVALAGLVRTGNQGVATAFLDELVASGQITETELKTLLPLLDEYNGELKNIENEAKLAGGASEDAAGNFANLGGAAGEGAEEVDALTAALEGLEAILEGRSEMREYEQSVDDFADAMGERKAVIAELKQAQEDLAKAETPEERSNARERIADLKQEMSDFALTLDIGTQAGRDWEERLDNIAGTALVAAENLTGLDQRRYLRGARRDFIDAATELGKTRKEARDLWDELVRLDEAEIEVGVNLKTRISGPGGAAYEGKLLGQGFADGGYTGNVPPRDVAGVVHGREFVFDAQMTAMYRPLFEEWHRARRVPGYREGGYVQAQNATTNYYATTNTLSGGGQSIDYDRLASAMLSARPVYGDVTVQPHNYNDFVQQMAEDQRRAALGGANF